MSLLCNLVVVMHSTDFVRRILRTRSMCTAFGPFTLPAIDSYMHTSATPSKSLAFRLLDEPYRTATFFLILRMTEVILECWCRSASCSMPMHVSKVLALKNSVWPIPWPTSSMICLTNLSHGSRRYTNSSRRSIPLMEVSSNTPIPLIACTSLRSRFRFHTAWFALQR